VAASPSRALRDRGEQILWVGSDAGLPEANPWFALARVIDLDAAFALPLESYDALILNAPDGRAATRDLERLGGSDRRLPPIALCLPSLDGVDERVLRAAGAEQILTRGRARLGPHALEAVARLARRGRRGPLRAPAPARFGGLRSRSRAMTDVLAMAERAARSNANLLLCGETGTGKEVLARALHQASARARGPFVALNCAALPEALLESELFGHMRGAFTGADQNRSGLFEAAQDGTLFLDEIAEMAPALQAKLLRALQEGEVRPLGGTEIRHVDTRVVGATHRDLSEEIAAGRFRSDLYYRLAVICLKLPPLRKRHEDILPLARALLQRHAEREHKPGCVLSQPAGDLLLAYAWPGNIRELENELQRALTWVDAHGTLEPEHFSERVRGELEASARPGAAGGGETLREQVERYEAWVIRRVLDGQGGRKAATARRLGLTREGLYKKMKRLGVE
jgi:transcriptional regulator with PAS, ATPase and Fis domain